MEEQTIAVYRNQEIQPETQTVVTQNFEIFSSIENGVKVMTLVDEDNGAILFKIGVFNHDVFKRWQTAFTQLQKYNRKENEEKDRNNGKY